jgi:hypothetical protein
MERRTRISLRRFFVLVTYIAVVMCLTAYDGREETPTNPLCWVYYFGRRIPHDNASWPYLVCGLVLLIGTLPPFFLFRWWTLLPALACGALYIAIGFEAVLHKFLI